MTCLKIYLRLEGSEDKFPTPGNFHSRNRDSLDFYGITFTTLKDKKKIIISSSYYYYVFFLFFRLLLLCLLLMSECFYLLLLLFISGTKTWNSPSKTELQQQRGNIVQKLNVSQINQGEWFLFIFVCQTRMNY